MTSNLVQDFTHGQHLTRDRHFNADPFLDGRVQDRVVVRDNDEEEERLRDPGVDGRQVRRHAQVRDTLILWLVHLDLIKGCRNCVSLFFRSRSLFTIMILQSFYS